MRRPIPGTKVILEYDGLFLAYQRDHDPAIRFPGRWDFLGGGLEETDKDLLDCGRREVQEEIGIWIANMVMLDEVPSEADPAVILGRAYGRLTAGQAGQIGGLILTEGRGLGLFTPAQIGELDFVPQLQEYFFANLGTFNRVPILEQTA
jgi:8-oxo-dGTP pyrophosphatase MutT (NUDIX family)